jgi:hypothetical protein
MKYDENENREVNEAAAETRFPDIQRILDDAVEGHDIDAHGPFWRNVTRDEFVTQLVFKCPIIFSENGTLSGPRSPLVQILRNPIECPANRSRPQMPFGFPAVPAEKIQIISDWIDAQCPA